MENKVCKKCGYSEFYKGGTYKYNKGGLVIVKQKYICRNCLSFFFQGEIIDMYLPKVYK